MRRSSASSLHPFDSSDEMESWGGGTDGWGGWGAMFPPLFDFQGTLFMANQPHMAVHHFCSYTHLTTSTFKCLPPFSPSGGRRDIRDQTWHPVPSVHQHFAVPVKQCKIPPLLSLFFPNVYHLKPSCLIPSTESYLSVCLKSKWETLNCFMTWVLCSNWWISYDGR